MQSPAILRGIIDVQAEEIGRLMSLVEHLTESLEQSQSREKAALQRCKELELQSTSSSAAERRASEAFLTSSLAAGADARHPPDEKELSETYADVLLCLLDYHSFQCILNPAFQASRCFC
jgi:hypothetical protein